MSDARITVCVPTIGRMEYLPKTEASFRAQTRKDVEVVILDNGSGADAHAFVDAWAARDKNVRVIRSQPRVPMLENFNLGIRAARTEFVTFFHDDDEYKPDFLEVLVGVLEKNPSAGVSGSNFDLIDENGEITEKRRWIPRDSLMTRRDYVKSLVSRGRNLIPMPGLVFRRSILGDGFDANLPIYFGDYILLMRYAEVSDIAVIAKPVMRIRRHAAQASHVPFSKSIPMRTQLLLEYLDGYVTRYPEDAAMVRALRRRVMLTHSVSLVWGWASVDDDEERELCLRALDKSKLDIALQSSLTMATALGLRPEKAVNKALTLVRRVAETLQF